MLLIMPVSVLYPIVPVSGIMPVFLTGAYRHYSKLSCNYLNIRPCFALSALTRNTPASTLLSQNLPGGFICVPCFLRLLRVLRTALTLSSRQNLQHSLKIYIPTLISRYLSALKSTCFSSTRQERVKKKTGVQIRVRIQK